MFTEGEEMYLQGSTVWHPDCKQSTKTEEKLRPTRTSSESIYSRPGSSIPGSPGHTIYAKVDNEILDYKDLAAIPKVKAIYDIERPDLITYEPFYSSGYDDKQERQSLGESPRTLSPTPSAEGYQDGRDRMIHRSTSQGSINSPVYSRHSYTPTTSRSPQHFHRPDQGINIYRKPPIYKQHGFYVTMVVNRWWAQYTSIPLPDQLMCVISATVHGVDQRGRLLRRTLIRYANLASVLVLRSVSTRVLKRFPTMEHVVDAGFMSQEERKKFESLKSDFNKYWIPCVWFTNLAAQARRDGRIRDDIALCLLLEELNKYRAKCSMLFHYDWISIPLVYTQVVTIAVYSFFALSLVGRQFVEPVAGAATPREPLEPGQAAGDLDMYVPLTTLLQFFFYAGWLKVAEQIINPFGEDDDDFETNQLIDRNLQVSLLSVDDMYQNLPPAEKDAYWDEDSAQPPYTVATVAESLRPSFLGSTFNLRMSDDPEQSLQVEASPGPARPVTAQTPLLGRFLGVGAPSPAISLRNFGRIRAPRTPHLVRFRAEEGGDIEAADRIEEEASGSGDETQEP